MPSSSDFQNELDTIFAFARQKRLTAIILKSGNLHRIVGGYPGKDHRMPICCNVMRSNILKGDEVLSEPPSGMGASLEILYKFPRNK